MTKVLLIVDLQDEYFPGGCLPLPHIAPAAENVARLLTYFREAKAPVVHVMHDSGAKDGAFSQSSKSWRLHHPAEPQSGENVIVKNHPNAFRLSWLHTTLQAMNVTELVIVGAQTQLCIDSTARSAIDFGYPTTVVVDACAAGDLEWNGERIPAEQVQRTFLAALDAILKLTTTAEILAAPLAGPAAAAQNI
ncbi:MAG TPA: cysteine hydrolase family protein [Azospirillaceae bacterium]|nr:cysteine hydrolase family protein [Azospirillaceae bacterium]